MALGPCEGDHRASAVLLICAQGPQLALSIFIEPCDSSPDPCEEIRPALERLWLSAFQTLLQHLPKPLYRIQVRRVLGAAAAAATVVVAVVVAILFIIVALAPSAYANDKNASGDPSTPQKIKVSFVFAKLPPLPPDSKLAWVCRRKSKS